MLKFSNSSFLIQSKEIITVLSNYPSSCYFTNCNSREFDHKRRQIRHQRNMICCVFQSILRRQRHIQKHVIVFVINKTFLWKKKRNKQGRYGFGVDDRHGELLDDTCLSIRDALIHPHPPLSSVNNHFYQTRAYSKEANNTIQPLHGKRG